MNTTTITIQKAQKQFTRLLELALQGNEVVITKNDVPFVRLVPVQPQPRVGNLHKGAMQMKPDFNEPLPDEFWLGTE